MGVEEVGYEVDEDEYYGDGEGECGGIEVAVDSTEYRGHCSLKRRRRRREWSLSRNVLISVSGGLPRGSSKRYDRIT